MKIRNIIASFLFMVPFSLPAQPNTKQKDIQQLITVIRIESSMTSMVNQGIELLKKEKPAVPETVWLEIKNSIDYSEYLKKVTEIFDNHYTSQEIKDLIAAAPSAKNKIPPFKNMVQKQLYETGNEFGRNFGNAIKEKLKSKGYM